VTPAFEPPDLNLPILANGEETIRDGNALILLRRKEHDVAIDGLDCEWKARPFFNLVGKLLEVLVGCSFSPNIERINQCVYKLKSPALGQFFCD
jgi:hypothetical protein